MSIVPREIQEKLENQEEQIRILNLKLKKISQEKDEIFGKFKSNRFGLWFFLILLIGCGCFYYFYLRNKAGVSNEDVEKIKQENEFLTVENKTIKTSLDDCLLKGGKISSENKLSSYEGVIYRVQIGAFKKFRVRPYSEGVSSLIDEYSIDLYKKYSVGAFDNKNNAEKLRRDLRKLGFRDCFIVYEYKGNRISYKEAMKINKRKK